LAVGAIALLAGHITDKTTGQPLVGVTVATHAAGKTISAVTDRNGRFAFTRIAPGRYTLTMTSNDVPPQSTHVTVVRGAQSVTVKACSSTLDYLCGGDNASPDNGSG
jgi:5-hydroxyisourate hydrolase-like protein (transthyretin family)